MIDNAVRKSHHSNDKTNTDTNMSISTENDITAAVAKQLREEAGLTQAEFWTGVGSNQSSGHWFEGGRRKSIPRPIRMLIFLRHVAKMPVNVGELGGAQEAIEAGEVVAALRAKRDALEADKLARELARKTKLKSA